MSTITARARTLAGRAIERWRDIWFPLAPLSDLAAARVLLAATVLYLNGELRFFWVPRAKEVGWQPIAMIELLGISQPSEQQMWILLRATQALLVAGAAGFLTNLALLGAFALQLVQEALLNCFGKVAHSTIPLLHAMLFFALAPCGRAYSVDAWIRRLRTRSRDRVPPTESRFARWPFELLFVEVAFYYFAAGVSKLTHGGLAWADGATLQYYFLERGTEAGAWAASYPLLCLVLSWCVFAFELGFPLAIFVRRLRIPFLAAGVCFHVANHYLMDLLYWPVPAVYLLVVPLSQMRRVLSPVSMSLRRRVSARAT